jgi:hypothetical protein
MNSTSNKEFKKLKEDVEDKNEKLNKLLSNTVEYQLKEEHSQEQILEFKKEIAWLKQQVEFYKVRGGGLSHGDFKAKIENKLKCEKLYETYFGGKVQMDENFDLKLDLSNMNHSNFFSEISQNALQLPNINKLNILNISPDFENFSSTLSITFPDKVETLSLGIQDEIDEKVSFSVDTLETILSKVKKFVYLYSPFFTQSGVERIIKAAPHLETLIFSYNSLPMKSNLKLMGPEYSIKTLAFYDSQSLYNYDFTIDKKKITYIAHGIRDSGLKLSLVSLGLNLSRFELSKAKEIVDQIGLKWLKIVKGIGYDQNIEPY